MYQLLMSGSVLGSFFQILPISLFVGILYGVFRYRALKRHGNFAFGVKEWLQCLFVCYLTGLSNLVLVPNNLWTYVWFYIFNGYSGGEISPLFTFDINLVPSLYRYLTGELIPGSWTVTMLIGNMIMFIPMGLFLPFVTEKITRRNIIPVAFIIPLIIELIQPVLGRSFDTDDLLMNLIGILIGYLIALIIKTPIKNAKKPPVRIL